MLPYQHNSCKKGAFAFTLIQIDLAIFGEKKSLCAETLTIAIVQEK